MEHNLGKLDEEEWILLNPEEYNFHRTFYDSQLFNLLKNNIKNLSSIDRLMFQNNAFAFVGKLLFYLKLTLFELFLFNL